MDLISRQSAIDVADAVWRMTGDVYVAKVWDQLRYLPSAQPELIRCRDCLMHGVCRFEKAFGLDGYCSQAERG